MRILALDTATSACTVAVADGARVLAELTLQVPRAHSTRLMPLVARAVAESGLSKKDLDLLAVGVGPGSFTGLRIGLSTVKGLAFALGKPCVPVSTLAATAYGTGAQAGLVVPLFDAKREQVYTAVYAAGDCDPATWTELLSPTILHVDQLAEELDRLRAASGCDLVTLCGDAVETYAGRLRLGSALRLAQPGLRLPRASAVAQVGLSRYQAGGAVEPDALVPLYLRKSEAETLWESRTSPSSR